MVHFENQNKLVVLYLCNSSNWKFIGITFSSNCIYKLTFIFNITNQKLGHETTRPGVNEVLLLDKVEHLLMLILDLVQAHLDEETGKLF